MLTMFAAVSTLNLATSGLLTGTASWSGRKGLWSTMASLNLLGAVINLSVLFIIGDRLERNGTLERRQVMVLSRIFCAAAFGPLLRRHGGGSPMHRVCNWAHTAFWHTGGLAGHGADGLAGRATRRGDL
jgi:hypothetical protein